MATDINDKALEASLNTAKHNNCHLEAFKMNLSTNLVDRLKGKLDILIFNPPYVVTDKQELKEAQAKRDIEASWAGGEQGIEVLMNLLP